MLPTSKKTQRIIPYSPASVPVNYWALARSLATMRPGLRIDHPHESPDDVRWFHDGGVLSQGLGSRQDRRLLYASARGGSGAQAVVALAFSTDSMRIGHRFRRDARPRDRSHHP